MSTQLGRLRRTWFDAWWFWIRTTLLRHWRRLRELGTRPERHAPQAAISGAAGGSWSTLAEVRTPLWTSAVASEWPLVAGKVENLRRALPAFHGLRLPAGAVLSFWRQLGRPSRWRGFVLGRELREGCVVPAPGGGLCQLSNALFQLAQQAGWQVLERHRHSMILPGSQAAADRDATVFWNHVDLRLRVPAACRLLAGMGADHLWLRIEVEAAAGGAHSVPLLDDRSATSAPVASCFSCAQAQCARHVVARVVPATPVPRSAILSVGAPWPEFVQWRERQPDATNPDLLRHDAELGERALGWWARHRGHTRAQRQLAAEQRAAGRLARRLLPTHTRLQVPQSLLPHLWLDGTLGGRRFDVLLTRPPLAQLHETLDACARAHPGSATAQEFRASAQLVAAELAALAAAERWLTPFAGLLDGGPDPRPHQLLPWCAPRSLPLLRPRRCTPRVLFPLATAARHGAFELREALHGLPVQLLFGGSELEGPDFWISLAARRLKGPGDWRREVDLVALPAWTSGRPQVLLQARAAGIPVITTAACGLRACAGVTVVPVGNVAALRMALQDWLDRREHAQTNPGRSLAGAC